ncbi:MAG: ArsO family NAD(P)H-dependent flavin-containing monooxygenase [Brumimicrobium sp.]
MSLDQTKIYDCVIIGGGQSALACAYFMRRSELNYVILDKNTSCGGAWSYTWDSLHLFSPAKFNLLPGWPMPDTDEKYPTRDEMIAYLCQYEKRYGFPVFRDVNVISTRKSGDFFELETSKGIVRCKAIISATGTYEKPFIPVIPGLDNFNGEQIHSSKYKNQKPFEGKKVLVVGGGNSGAQILADLDKVATCFWGVKSEPEFLPPNVDGSVLFDSATKIYQNKKEGKKLDTEVINLGNIVRTPQVKKAESEGVYKYFHFIESFTENGVVWTDGTEQELDSIVWCTGFGYATQHLEPTVIPDSKGKLKVEGNHSLDVDGLWLVGYGGWTGFASATVIGVGRTAKSTVKECVRFVESL